MNENLQTNAFFLALQDHIPDLEKCCVKSGWTLCVPHSSAMPESHRMSLRLLKMHVLKPTAQSGMYETLNPSILVRKINDKELEVTNKCAEAGKANPTIVSILYKEVVYCGVQGTDSYTIVCISKPLDGHVQIPLLEDGTEVFAEERSAQEWHELLFADPYTQKRLEALENAISNLENPLEGRKEPIAYTEIKNFAEKMSKECLDVRFEAARTVPRYNVIFQTAWENTTVWACHGVIFAALAQRHADDEKELQIRLHDLRRLVVEEGRSVEHLGLTDAFLSRFNVNDSPSFNRAAEHLQQLNECKSPLEKLWCLRDASRCLREIPGNDNMDDSLPIFLLCLLTAAPGLLLANMAFMADFAPRIWVKSAGELTFHCTCLSGAISLIQQHVLTRKQEDDVVVALRKLVMIGGSNLTGTWSVNAAQNNGGNNPLAWFESCAPVFRRE